MRLVGTRRGRRFRSVGDTDGVSWALRWDGGDPEARRLLRALDDLPASVRAPYCSGQLVVTRDGQETVGTLDPWTLTPVIDALFER